MAIKLPRRVVTGVNAEGKSCIAIDGPPDIVLDHYDEGGSHVSWMWGSDGLPTVPHDGSDPFADMTMWFPVGQGARLILETLAAGFGVETGPGSETHDDVPPRALQLPFTFNAQYQDSAGVHSSDTIDYAIIISGAIWMQMEDGSEVKMEQGDCVVQTGVRHTWRNRGSEPCRIAFIILGAERTSDPEAAASPAGG